jgi:hypothetical protein
MQKQIKNELTKLDEQIQESKALQEILADEARPIYTVYRWEAPERIYEPKTRNWYVSIGTVAMIVIVVSALTANFGLIFAVVALILFIYALNTIPPKTVAHEITNKGVKTHNFLFTWKNILGFWVLERGKHTIINMDVRESVKDQNFERLIMLKGKGDVNRIVAYLVQHIDYLSSREVPNNIIIRLTQGEYVPLLRFLGETTFYTKDPNDSPKPPAKAPAETKPAAQA